jgi:hypothetical protein
MAMNPDPNDVVKVYSGTLIDVEQYREVLRDAGIDCRIVGSSLTTFLGNAIPDTVELWTHRGDAERATQAIETYETEPGEEETSPPSAHPSLMSKPKGTLHYQKEPYVNPDPRGG